MKDAKTVLGELKAEMKQPAAMPFAEFQKLSATEKAHFLSRRGEVLKDPSVTRQEQSGFNQYSRGK